VSAGFRRLYGAPPLHLAGHVAAIAVGAYAVAQVLDPRFSRPINYLAWLLGGALLHDLVLLPLYTALDRAVRAAGPLRGVHITNHVRFPAVIAGVLFLVYFPLIVGNGRENYIRASGHEPPDYLARWLAITGGVFAVSAAILAFRVIAARRRRAPAPSPKSSP